MSRSLQTNFMYKDTFLSKGLIAMFELVEDKASVICSEAQIDELFNSLDCIYTKRYIIEERIDYIVKKIYESSEIGVSRNAEEYFQDSGKIDFSNYYYTGRISIIDKDKNIIKLHDSFPERWLWESFEKELELGKILYKKKNKNKLKKILLTLDRNELIILKKNGLKIPKDIESITPGTRPGACKERI